MKHQKQDKISGIQAALEHRILKGLSCEWETSLWVLDGPLLDRMKKPIFSLGNGTAVYGSWIREHREIRISRNLVENHPWDAVREVLRHEMAHQMADEVFSAAGEPDHGMSFLKACDLLGANPKASGKYPALDELVFRKRQSPEDTKLRQIKKLMALAESRNHHEAEAAMAKAHELIARYNIRIHDADDRPIILSIFLGKPALRRSRDVYHLTRLICDFYFVEGIWVPSFVLEKGKMGTVLEISGTGPNLKIADYIYDYVRRFIDSQWDGYKEGKKMSWHRKTDYAVGIIEGLRTKLSTAVSGKNICQGRDLVKIKDGQLAGYIKKRYPRTKKIYRNADVTDDGVRRDGVDAGKTLIISKGVSQHKKTDRLIPG